jgi:hypothetical protein
MEIFSLRAQVLGVTYEATATGDGLGITVETSDRAFHTHSVREAMRVARNYLGPILHSADRRHAPWGLYVSAAGVAAVYGSWPLLPAGPPVSAATVELVTRIRREYRDGSASAALENALRIIEAYTSDRRAA